MNINAFGTDNFLKHQIRARLEKIRVDDMVSRHGALCLQCYQRAFQLIERRCSYVADDSRRGYRLALDQGTATSLSIPWNQDDRDLTLEAARRVGTVDRVPLYEQDLWGLAHLEQSVPL
jgi:hypothetical protein